MSKIQLAVFFGGVTVEHEVSIITGVQLIKHANPEKYDVIPVYVDKSGHWWTGEQAADVNFYKTQDLFKPTGLTPFTVSLQRGENSIDVAVLCFHGGYGEAGNVQGALELAGIPYQGPAVVSSAAAFDKIVARQIMAAEGIHQAKYVWFTKLEWQKNRAQIEDKIASLEYPVFIKPANGGSTIGIERAKNGPEVAAKVKSALQYDDRILVEQEITDCIEVNVSVLGDEATVRASVPEQPIKTDEFLSYADKYERGGGKKTGMASLSRRIPAPISQKLTTKLQDLAKKLFVLFDCSGVVRIDFFANPSTEEIFVVELNTLPGSMSYYLWEATGVSYPQLIDELVAVAERKFKANSELITSYDSNILKKN
jgi:D-alanine-D-alanine ligase